MKSGNVHCMREVRGKTVKWGLVDEFTRLEVQYQNSTIIKYYAYGWCIFREGYYYRMIAMKSTGDKPDVRRARTLSGAMYYCRANPCIGCRNEVRRYGYNS